MTRIAVVQPALALAQVEPNLEHLEDLIRDAQREHSPDVIVVPEACTSPNVYARVLNGAARPVDGQPFQMLTRLARELDCILCGGFLAVRGKHTFGTFVMAEPDGSVHLHDKDIPTAWEHNYYTAGDDDGVVESSTLGVRVGLMSGWEWARNRTSGRVRDAGVQLVLGGMCWPSMPLNWPGPLRVWANHEHAVWRRQAMELPGQVARLTGVPVAHASHVGPVEGETPFGPGIPWRTQMIGESQLCDRDGTILGRLTLEDGEGHFAGDVELKAPAPLDPIGDRFWIPDMSLTTHLAWHGMNAHGAVKYRVRHALKRFPWQQWPAGDLPDEIPASSPAETAAATT